MIPKNPKKAADAYGTKQKDVSNSLINWNLSASKWLKTPSGKRWMEENGVK